MWTHENRAQYDRDGLRVPSDLTNAECPVTDTGFPVQGWLTVRQALVSAPTFARAGTASSTCPELPQLSPRADPEGTQ